MKCCVAHTPVRTERAAWPALPCLASTYFVIRRKHGVLRGRVVQGLPEAGRLQATSEVCSVGIDSNSLNKQNGIQDTGCMRFR